MATITDFDWAGASEIEQLQRVRSARPADLNDLLKNYDWEAHPESVLGWATAQKGIELCAAMTAFFNADPMRFNYLPGRDVPAAHRGICRLLDAICLRVNAGFYLPEVSQRCERLSKLEAWVHYQQEDVADHRRGRWVFDEETLEPLLKQGHSTEVHKVIAPGQGFSLSQVMRPLLSL